MPPKPPDDSDQAAEVTPEDRLRAPRFWAAYGTPLFRALLNAVKKKPDGRA